MCKISFIVPAYNVGEGELKRCLASILALPIAEGQRQVIVVDDGSEQPIGGLPAGVELLRLQHGGLSAARNAGLRQARGEYIQFVDADDELLPNAYAFCLRTAFDGDADLLLFNLTRGGRQNGHRRLSKPMTGVDYMLHHNLRASACGYLFRRCILGDLQFSEGLLHEDEEFTPQLLLRAQRLICTDTAAYLYHRTRGSITSSQDAAHTLKRLDDTETIILRLHLLISTLQGSAQAAMERRRAQLTMDYLYNILRLTHSTAQLRERMHRLESKGLRPLLPRRHYTWKYSLFRLFIISVLQK